MKMRMRMKARRRTRRSTRKVDEEDDHEEEALFKSVAARETDPPTETVSLDAVMETASRALTVRTAVAESVHPLLSV